MYCYHNITVIAHPKTGSKSLAKALTEQKWNSIGHHHSMVSNPTGSIISVIREPKDWYVSWYFHCGQRKPFLEWLRTFVVSESSTAGFYGLPFTTHLIFFDRLQIGLNAVFKDFGEPIKTLPHLNHLGRYGRQAHNYFDPVSESLLDPKMVKEYDSLKNKLGDKPYLRRLNANAPW